MHCHRNFGPRPLSLATYLGDLAQGMDLPRPRAYSLPAGYSPYLGWLGELGHSRLLSRDSLVMLGGHSQTADPGPLQAIVGRPLRDPKQFSRPTDRAAAVNASLHPLARYVLAALWLWTAWVSWFAFDHGQSMTWLAACGVPQASQSSALLLASCLDAGIGLALLHRPPRWLWPLQITLVLGYTVLLSLFMPDWWLHPFGPLSKNLPIMVLMAYCWLSTGIGANLRKE